MKRFPYLLPLIFACMSISCKSVELSGGPVVFDCDPGTDDAIAMKLMSVYGPRPAWSVSTFGNMTWDYTNRNLNILTRLFGLESQVAVGAKTPYDGHTVSCGDFHGADGLADQADRLFSELGMTGSDIDSNKSVKELAEYICSEEEVTYIAVGPLSTLAHLITDYPQTVSHIAKAYVMGGGIEHFNKDGNKEYNFAGDGIAVKAVFDSPLDITLFPLDITNVYAIISRDEIESMDFSRQPEIKAFLSVNYRSNRKYNKIDAAVMHDCLPVLYLQQPSRFVVEDMLLKADVTGHIERSSDGRNVHVAVSCPKDLIPESIKSVL